MQQDVDPLVTHSKLSNSEGTQKPAASDSDRDDNDGDDDGNDDNNHNKDSTAATNKLLELPDVLKEDPSKMAKKQDLDKMRKPKIQKFGNVLEVELQSAL